MRKMSAKCEKMSTLNVKMARSAKCENNSTLNVSFLGILGFRGVNISKVKNAVKCHDLHRKCKISIREWVGLFGKKN